MQSELRAVWCILGDMEGSSPAVDGDGTVTQWQTELQFDDHMHVRAEQHFIFPNSLILGSRFEWTLLGSKTLLHLHPPSVVNKPVVGPPPLAKK